jgi:hypothetical protein
VLLAESDPGDGRHARNLRWSKTWLRHRLETELTFFVSAPTCDFDRDGYVLITKRLERGTFRVPWGSESGHVVIEAAELLLVLEGIELSGSVRRARWRHVRARREEIGEARKRGGQTSLYTAAFFVGRIRRTIPLSMRRMERRVGEQKTMLAEKASPITSAMAPDLDAVRRFIADMIARGAIVALIAAVVGLLTRMRDLNTELMARLANKSRKRPPSETMHRPQLELLLLPPAANDGAAPPAPPKPDKKPRGPKNHHRHGRPKLPAHQRVLHHDVRLACATLREPRTNALRRKPRCLPLTVARRPRVQRFTRRTTSSKTPFAEGLPSSQHPPL